MPRKYQRKADARPRALWTEEQLQEAIIKVSSGEMSKREAFRCYHVPPKTLTRRMASGKLQKGNLGPESVLGYENEKRLVIQIQRLAEAGFAPDRITIRRLAYSFAEKLNLNHNFSRKSGMAGPSWLTSFLERNPELLIRRAEGLLSSRARRINMEEILKFFQLLTDTLLKNDLLNKPSHIYTMDETVIELTNKPGEVLTTEAVEDVLVSDEGREYVTAVASCNAEGRFLPPVLIFKGVIQEVELSDGLPTGSKILMNEESSFINSSLLLKWLREQFIPNKPFGKCLLLMDGHTRHCSDGDLLQVADDNDIDILCLPSHCTHAFQPLDQSFFNSFKLYFNQEAQLWMEKNHSKILTRYQAGELIGKAWSRSASVSTAINGFKATGIYPVDPNAFMVHLNSIMDSAKTTTETFSEVDANLLNLEFPPTSSASPFQTCSGGNDGDNPKIAALKLSHEGSGEME